MRVGATRIAAGAPRGNVALAGALLVLSGCGGQQSAGPPSALEGSVALDGEAPAASSVSTVVSTCAITPIGVVHDRWSLTGAEDGPLGSATGDAHPIGDAGSAWAQDFAGGEIVTAPALGPAAAVAVYSQGSDVAVDWGDSAPGSFEPFAVRWSLDGGAPQQRTTKTAFPTRGIWFLPLPKAGTYSVLVGGCRSGDCSSAWSPTASVRFAPPPSDVSPVPCPGGFDPKGAIGRRWRALLGADGVLGCPTARRARVQGARAVRQDFAHGQMVFSPAQGAAMVVSLFEQDGTLVLDWSSTAPSSYDRFLVRDAVTGAQLEVSAGSTTDGGQKVVASSVVAGSTYSFIVEGCNHRFLAPAACEQGWTAPVSWQHRPKVTPPPAPTGPALLDYSRVAAVSSAAHVDDEIAERGRIAAEYWACNKSIEKSVTGDEQDWMSGALGRLDMLARGQTACGGKEGDGYRAEINQSLMRQSIGSAVGSTMPFPCTRTGEYDVALTGYVRILAQYARFLEPQVKERIADILLNQVGQLDDDQLVSCTVPLVGSIDETENHVNAIESARYLTNQVRYAEQGAPEFDDEANGMNRYWLERLQGYLRSDFSEYNSKNYQAYTDNAIQNLYDFAKDRRVKEAARLVLDFISAKWSFSSSVLRRNAPYRRRVSDYSSFLLNGMMENQPGRFLLFTGTTQILGDPDFTELHEQPFVLPPAGWSGNALDADVSGYRPPSPTLDAILNPLAQTYYQRMRHAGVEVYASRPEYLIAAGGVYVGPTQDILGLGKDNAGVAVPTVLVPRDRFVDTGHMIRFEGVAAGVGNDWIGDPRRANTCVAPDFACGVNLQIPALYTANGCATTQTGNGGTWTFVDFASPGCRPAGATLPIAGFYLAAWSAKAHGAFANYGFFEAHPVEAALTFSDFRAGVLQRNAGATFVLTATNRYVMTSGRALEFVVPVEYGVRGNPLVWPFVTLGDPALDRLGGDIAAWPLAAGDVMTSGPDGLVVFHDGATDERVVMDFRDVGEPQEGTVAPPATIPPPAAVPSPAASPPAAAIPPPAAGPPAAAIPPPAAGPSAASVPLTAQMRVPRSTHALCGALPNTAAAVRPTIVTGAAPAMTGGAVDPGTYALTAYALYRSPDAGAAPAPGLVRETARFTDVTLTTVARMDQPDGGASGEEGAVFAFTASGNTISLEHRCGATKDETATYTVGRSPDGRAIIELLFGDALLSFTKR